MPGQGSALDPEEIHNRYDSRTATPRGSCPKTAEQKKRIIPGIPGSFSHNNEGEADSPDNNEHTNR